MIALTAVPGSLISLLSSFFFPDYFVSNFRNNSIVNR